MNKKGFLVLVLTLLLAFSVSIAFADETDIDGDYPWRDHAAPLDFWFDNMIDSHQQSFTNGLVKDDEGQYDCPDQSKCTLKGFIYIDPTGAINETFGVPEAQKADCYLDPNSCVIGWVVKAVWVEGVKLVNMGPRIWLIEEDQIPDEPGYSHFQWVGKPGKPHGLVIYEEGVNEVTYSGFLMKRIAPAPFFWLGGSGSGGSGGGGCGGHETGDEGGCSDGEHEEGGCSGGGGSGSGGMGGSPGGGCSEGDTGCTDGGHDDGGCTDGGDEGGCSGGGEDDGCGGGDEGGCGGSGGDHGGGSPGRYVSEGVDSHSNIVTVWDGTWHGGCHED